jgi:hypothetical protein
VLQTLDQRLWSLPFDLHPLRDAVWQQRARGVNMHPDGTVEVAPMPWVGPEAYAFVLYPSPPPGWVAEFHDRTGRTVPEPYAAVLSALNGCFAFALALFGLPPSLHGRPPHHRRALEPLDLEAANRYWMHDYRDADGEFHLGGRTWSDTESVGYFLDPGGVYRCRRKNGEILGEWPSLGELLAQELPAAETRERERWTGRSWPWEVS